MGHDFETLVAVLKGNPKEQCVMSQEFLNDLDILPTALGKASDRTVSEATEYLSLSEKNMALRSIVFVFAPAEDQ